jgi:hypothetical protein
VSSDWGEEEWLIGGYRFSIVYEVFNQGARHRSRLQFPSFAVPREELRSTEYCHTVKQGSKGQTDRLQSGPGPRAGQTRKTES